MSLSSSTVGGKTKLKFVLLGDQHVGKTSIIQRFINDRFENTYDATIGIDFLVRNLTSQNKHYRLQLWDTAGQQRFRSLIPSYLKDSNLCLLVYDVDDPKSLENLAIWSQLYSKHKQFNSFSIAVGNKVDKTSQCSQELIDRVLGELKINHHYQISAKTNVGVTELFHTSIELIMAKLSSIRIIDQIDQKEQRSEAEREDHRTGKNISTSKAGLGGAESASVLSTVKLQDAGKTESSSSAVRKCC